MPELAKQVSTMQIQWLNAKIAKNVKIYKLVKSAKILAELQISLITSEDARLFKTSSIAYC